MCVPSLAPFFFFFFFLLFLLKAITFRWRASLNNQDPHTWHNSARLSLSFSLSSFSFFFFFFVSFIYLFFFFLVFVYRFLFFLFLLTHLCVYHPTGHISLPNLRLCSMWICYVPFLMSPELEISSPSPQFLFFFFHMTTMDIVIFSFVQIFFFFFNSFPYFSKFAGPPAHKWRKWNAMVERRRR